MKKILFISLFLITYNVLFAEEDWLDKYTELPNKTTAELRLLRNEVYARHGSIFDSADLKEYFSKQDWYKSDIRYSDKLLTQEDKDLINEIKAIEKTLVTHVWTRNEVYIQKEPAEQLQMEQYIPQVIIKSKWGKGPCEFGVYEGDVEPTEFVCDDNGNIYVLDKYNNRIQKFDTNGKYLEMYPVKTFVRHTIEEYEESLKTWNKINPEVHKKLESKIKDGENVGYIGPNDFFMMAT
ncbi:MAG: YARHG domain-containing protein [Elusimicrobia bacterium]|nr:YARHG domain-containing protein [Elusimicrobiota bacterium]